MAELVYQPLKKLYVQLFFTFTHVCISNNSWVVPFCNRSFLTATHQEYMYKYIIYLQMWLYLLVYGHFRFALYVHYKQQRGSYYINMQFLGRN